MHILLYFSSVTVKIYVCEIRNVNFIKIYTPSMNLIRDHELFLHNWLDMIYTITRLLLVLLTKLWLAKWKVQCCFVSEQQLISSITRNQYCFNKSVQRARIPATRSLPAAAGDYISGPRLQAGIRQLQVLRALRYGRLKPGFHANARNASACVACVSCDA